MQGGPAAQVVGGHHADAGPRRPRSPITLHPLPQRPLILLPQPVGGAMSLACRALALARRTAMLRDFYGCYLLESKNPRAKGRSYIG